LAHGETLAEQLIGMVNVAADDMDVDGLNGQNNESIYPTDEDDRKLMKMKSSEREDQLSPKRS
jgi:hypothetical protein